MKIRKEKNSEEIEEDIDEEYEEGHRSPGSAAANSLSPNKRRGQGIDMS